MRLELTSLSQNISCPSYCFYMMCVGIKRKKYWRIRYVTCRALRFLNTTSYNLLITRKVCELLMFQLPSTHTDHLSLACWEVLESELCEGLVRAPLPSSFLLCWGCELTGQKSGGRWEGHQPCLLFLALILYVSGSGYCSSSNACNAVFPLNTTVLGVRLTSHRCFSPDMLVVHQIFTKCHKKF